MKGGHRLKAIPDFPTDVAAALAKYSIATAEEFLAEVATEGAELRNALTPDVSPLEFDKALSVARDSAGPEYYEVLGDISAGRDFPLGALRPTSDEFNEFLRKPETGEAP